MPIQQATLEAPENRYLCVSAGETLRGALRNLVSIPPRAEPWHYLLAQRSDGSWLAVRFSWLVDLAEEDRGRLDMTLGELELPAAQVVERGKVGTGEALRLARSAPGRVVVVMEDGRLAGIVCSGPTRGNGSFSAGQVEELVGPEEPKLETRYTDIGCPKRVTLGVQRFQVTVRLTLQRPVASKAASQLEVDPLRVVQVSLHAPDFEQLNSNSQEISLAPGQDSSAAVFDLRPREVGKFGIGLDFFQGDNPLGTVSFAVEVGEGRQADRGAEISALALPLGSVALPPDRILRVSWDEHRKSLRLSLIEKGSTAWHEFPAVELGEDVAASAQRLYGDIALWDQTLTHRPSDRAELEQRLQQTGWDLWRLLPDTFRQRYARERGAWHDGSLLILTDEPYLPWELTLPYGDGWQDEEPWCLSLRLSRWLRRDSEGNGNVGARQEVVLAALACLAPKGTSLPAAQAERAYLKKLCNQHGLNDASPDPFNAAALRRLLSSNSYDWFHAATHGDFEIEASDRKAILRLDEGKIFTPNDVSGPTVEGALRRKRPGFFFNACHAGRVGWAWGGLAGWAQRLIACGAGFYLAPLWPVDDEPAKCFVETLYPRLLKGEPVGEAVRHARRKAKEAGGSTWLAYSLYAHPNARVRVPRSTA